MISLGSITWGTGPEIPMTFAYEKQRSGSDMQYRVNVTISPLSGTKYFGYPIYLDLTMDGVNKGSATVKSATPYQWSSAITYTSPWYTVSGKINGTTSLVIRMYSGLGSSRTGTYAYTMEVEPAGATIEVVNGTLGTPLTFEVTRPNSSHTYSILYICGTKSGMVCSDSTASTMTWDTTNGNTVELATENTVGTSVSVLLRITTYNGSWPIFMRDYTISMVIPGSVKPSVALTVEDAAGHLATFGAFVQGWSKLKITATPTLAYGSPIKAYAITADGKTYDSTPVTTGAIQGKGTLTLTAKVTDSRERPSDVVSKNITVLEYYKPSVTAIAYRCNSSGAADPEGAYMRVGFTATLANLNNKNSASYEITYSGGTLTGTGTSFTSNPIACDVSKVWPIEVKVTDKFDSTTASAVVPIAFTLMDFYNTGKGVALGKVATRDGFDCAMDAYFTGGVTFDKGFVDGSDTGWMQLSTTTKYRCKNGYVTVVGTSYGDLKLTVGDYTLLGTLPVEYRPAYPIPMVYHKVGGDPSGQSGFVDNDGTVRLYAKVDYVDYWAFSVTYPL